MKAAVAVIVLSVCLVGSLLALNEALALPANYPAHDDFEDGVIDASLWVTGGAKRGWHESQAPGIGNWTYSIQEIVAADGYLQMRVEGPESGNTYGAEAWLQTVYNFNDGNDHLINFTWEAAILIGHHYDHYYIQITDGYIPYYGSVHWPRNQPSEGTVDFLWEDVGGELRAGAELTYGLPKSTWSLTISADGTGCLYDGPDGGGTLVYEGMLNPSYAWHIRFMVIDATSAGYPAGDDLFNMYDLSATMIPLQIQVDIKPQSCPNPLNTKSQGVIPVAILGTAGFDVTNVDPASVQLEGVSPLRWSYEDVATPMEPGGDVCDCTDQGPDGIVDLALKFKTQEIVAALGSVTDGEIRVLTLTGMTQDSTDIEGQDCVVIIHKVHDKKPRPLGMRGGGIMAEFGSYPNPFNAETEIRFGLLEESEVSVVVYNVLGEEVRTLLSADLDAGIHRVHWDGKDETGSAVASGIYFCRLKTEVAARTMKMIMLR